MSLPLRPEAIPDFRHIDTWLFDLDNTLYPLGSTVFPQIHARMTAYIERLLNVPREEAQHLRRTFFQGYGTTLAGLMAVHHIDPDDFLDFVHDIDLSGLYPDPGLRRGLTRVGASGRRIVFTNASREHAERILIRLGLVDCIDDIWDIRKSAFLPKPAAKPYKQLVAELDVDPCRAVFFEDIARNLVPAHELGMSTVWLHDAAEGGDPADIAALRMHITHETGDLAGFLMTIGIRDD